MAIVDNNYLLGNMNNVFAVNKRFAEDLAQVGLALQPQKSKCFIREGLQAIEWDAAGGTTPNGVITYFNGDAIIANNAPLFGITTCNIPIIFEEIVEGCLQQKSQGLDVASTTSLPLLPQALAPSRYAIASDALDIYWCMPPVHG